MDVIGHSPLLPSRPNPIRKQSWTIRDLRRDRHSQHVEVEAAEVTVRLPEA